jgi:hypothetical protein
MKNAVFLDVTPCVSCKNRRFGGKHRLHHQMKRISALETTLAVNESRYFGDGDRIYSPKPHVLIKIQDCG